MRPMLLAAALLLVAPLTAQAQGSADPDVKVAGGGTLPTGWQMRLDRANANAADVRFVTMGSGYHATMGPAAIFYNPTLTASGNYTAEATFTQMKAPRHPEAYGLVIAGKNLDRADQDYFYFIVRGDGKYMVKHRAGAETHTIADWTAHPAVATQDAAGKATNKLTAVSSPTSLTLLVNGQQVAEYKRADVPYLNTTGLVGLRVNHNLDVHIDGPKVTRN